MTDAFFLKKNTNNTQTVLTKEAEPETSTRASNNSMCGPDGCDIKIIDGINIGWIWNNVESLSSRILGMTRNNPFKPKNNRTSKEQLQELNNLVESYSSIQHKIKKIVITIIIIAIIYYSSLPIGSERRSYQYFNITQICYFIRELLENKDDYNFKFFIIISISTLLLFGQSSLSSLISVIIILWIILGNLIFSKNNTYLFAILFISSFLTGILNKSLHYYIERVKLNSTDYTEDTDDMTISRATRTVRKIILSINITICILIIYILYNNYNVNVDSNKLEGYTNLSHFFKDKIFGPVARDQQELVQHIAKMGTDFKKLGPIDKTFTEVPYKSIKEQLSFNMKINDMWIKHNVHHFNIETYDYTNMLGDISSFTKIKDLGKAVCADPTKINHLWTSKYITNDFVYGIAFRTLEIILQTVVSPIIVGVNIIKLFIKFIFNNPGKKIKNIRDLNLVSFYNFELIFAQEFLLVWKRVANMANLILIPK